MTTNYTGFLALSGSDSDTIGDTSGYSGTFGVTLTATLDASGNGTATETVGQTSGVISYSYNYAPSGYGSGSGTSPFYFTTPTLTFQQGRFQSSQFKIPIKVNNTYFYATLNGSITNQGTISEQLVGTISGVNNEGHAFAGTLGGNTTLACFLKGTKITTTEGRVAVESLAVGDMVALLAGGASRISWIGERGINCGLHPNPETVWPVRIAAGAFGDGLPDRDLFLSPDHAVYIDGVLIPIRYLVNGATVTQEPRDSITYYHIELASHDVILAESLPCETYLDTGNRSAFSNGGPAVQMHPDFALKVWESKACAPLVRDGAQLEGARSFLLERAQTLGHVTSRDPALHLVAGGRVIEPEIRGRIYRFRLPVAAGGVRLVSRSAVPAQVRADSVDHRRLGVAVSGILLDGTPILLNDTRLSSGWHDVEHDDGVPVWRWTDGDARLASTGACMLEIAVAMTVCFWREADRPDGRRQRSASA